MRALVITINPLAAVRQPGSPWVALRELGYDIEVTGYDLDEVTARPEVVVIDSGEHAVVGHEALRRVRSLPALSGVPVLFCVEPSRLPHLDPDADDFLLRPIVVPELHARLRRLGRRGASYHFGDRIEAGELVIDTVSLEASFRGHPLGLTRREFQLLQFLATHPERVFTRAELIAELWGDSHARGPRIVDSHVRHVRAKLGPAGAVMLQLVPRAGYKLHIDSHRFDLRQADFVRTRVRVGQRSDGVF